MAFHAIPSTSLFSRAQRSVVPALPACGGLALFGAALLGLPVNTIQLAQFEALNRELGKLCSNPPPKAHNVCRLHARLVNGF